MYKCPHIPFMFQCFNFEDWPTAFVILFHLQINPCTVTKYKYTVNIPEHLLFSHLLFFTFIIEAQAIICRAHFLMLSHKLYFWLFHPFFVFLLTPLLCILVLSFCFNFDFDLLHCSNFLFFFAPSQLVPLFPLRARHL